MLTLLQELDSSLNNTYFLCFVVGTIGLIVGSFLNVVIYRLPIMLQTSWREECQTFLDLKSEISTPNTVFNLALPHSHCPTCKNSIKPHQNIPVLSYLFLKGRCANCSAPISKRYPVIEALTALLSILIALHFGYSIQTLFALILIWSLICLSFIDIDHQLLPDNITQPLLWIGLLLSVFHIFSDTSSSIFGAIFGYLSLWTVFKVFKRLTGKDGMGYGDFKLLAVFGAWLGWQTLPLIILLSSLVGTVIGLIMISLGKRDHSTPFPFGPYLAVAGLLALLWGPELNQFYFASFGL